MKKLLVETITFTNRNLDILLLDIVILFIGFFSQRLGVLWWVFLLTQIGWIGTRVAFLRDSFEGQKNWLLNFGKYMWRYFKRFSPIVVLWTLIAVLIMIVGVVLLIQYYAQTRHISIREVGIGPILRELQVPVILEEVLSTYKLELFFLATFSTLFYPYLFVFVPLIVVRDISFFKGIRETFSYLRLNKHLYWLLVLLSIILLLVSNFRSLIFNIQFTPAIDAYTIAVDFINSYLKLFISSLCILYINKFGLNKDKIIYERRDN